MSDANIKEVRDVLGRPRIRAKNPALTDDSVAEFCNRVLHVAHRIDPVPASFRLARDPDDEPYLNLAVAVAAEYLVTRDNDLLELMTGQPDEDWDDDWLVVADAGGDPFILSRASGSVLHAVHGSGFWAPAQMFADLNSMAACLGHLGAVVVSAGEAFVDEDCLIRPEYHEQALAGLQQLLGVFARCSTA